MTLERGWAFWCWAVANDGWLQFNGVNQQSKGYLAQQIDKLMSEVQNGNGKR